MVKPVAPSSTRRRGAGEPDGVPEQLTLVRGLRYADGKRFAAGSKIRPRELGMSSETVRWLRQSGTVEA